MKNIIPAEIMQRLRERFCCLYGDSAEQCINRLRMLIGRYGVGLDPEPVTTYWNQTDNILITYADMVQAADQPPLQVLNSFLAERVGDVIKNVHILPFFPYSSDDGFSVIDYREVNDSFGTWKDVESLGENFGLMFDLVINHVSRKSDWFRQYINGILPARKYFIEMEPDADLSQVTRPRSSPLLTRVNTRDGERHVWTTFSDDQIDLDFSNPDVLFEFLDLIFFYISKGVRILRLDAIAYLWKKAGTTCIHLPETHEVVKLFRDVLDLVAPHVILLTETNVPNEENISYFGNNDEAHMVYQFSLPPLLLHALHTGNSTYLREWAASLPDLPAGNTFLNFTASHDGVGVRPLEGLIPDNELDALIKAILERGGHVSRKQNPDGSESPYELNITYFDALANPGNLVGNDDIARFLCSQTVSLSLKGLPAIYFHSITGTRNDYAGVEQLGYPRAINRRKWDEPDLRSQLDNRSTVTSRVFHGYVDLLRLRALHSAFHPNGKQEVLDLGPEIFAVKRQSPDNSEVILALHNMTGEEVAVGTSKFTGNDSASWHDLITDKPLADAPTLLPYQCMWLEQR